jgi:formate hydrogenlyase subunit 4
LITLPVYLVHMALLPFVLVGLIRKGKARLQGRTGPPLLQPLLDFAKRLRKGERVSRLASPLFRAAPVVQLAALGSVALMVGWLGVDPPISGDLFLVVYLLALARFVGGLAAMDTASPFGGLGASRQSTVSVQAEPAFMLAFGALAARAHSSSMSTLLAPRGADSATLVLVLLLIGSLWLTVMAEVARMPVDDPTTHLELTMIHETLVLENSGPTLALVEYVVGLETVVLLGLLAQVARLALPPCPALAGYLLTLGLMALAALVIVIAESTLVKMRWRRIPNFMSFAVALATLACLIAALKG